jgi:hypothetical protein
MTTATLRRLLRLAAALLLAIALLFSGSYVLIYLARWEWVRAQIAGLFFLSCLVMLAAALILRRIDAITDRPAAPGPSELRRGTPAAVDPDLRFPWLDAGGSTHVFLPILLGFGALLTLLASAVERLVGVVTSPAVGQRREIRPAPVWALALTATVAIGAAALIVIAGVTLMTRPDATTPGVRTYQVSVAVNQQLFTPTESLTTIAGLCRDRADIAGAELTVLQTADGPALQVSPIPGRFDSARFEGCLQDLILDHRKLRILDRIDEPAT